MDRIPRKNIGLPFKRMSGPRVSMLRKPIRSSTESAPVEIFTVYSFGFSGDQRLKLALKLIGALPLASVVTVCLIMASGISMFTV